MAANQLVQARINADVKREAAIVLEAMGLTISEAVRLMLTKVAREHALPFDVRTPSAVTRKAIAELEEDKGKRFDSVEDLMRELNDGKD